MRLGGGDVPDGTGNTIMLSENVHKDYENTLFSWLAGTEQQLGMVWVVEPNPVPGYTLVVQERINRETDLVGNGLPDPYDPNAPRFARPASYHRGVVLVVFCDGHGQPLNENIDYTVYQQLLTPNGRKCEDPESYRGPDTVSLPPTDPIRIFRELPPLSEADYQ